MTKNEGPLDRAVRVVIGIVLLALPVFGVAAGGLGWAAGIVGVVLIATGALGYCGLYRVLGVNTCPAPKQQG
ncbi:MAG: DUF2892 domain-containing protein [Trueperaceae bacterium]|nr:DUF2892 domain-containing protein [Trueperaceae bacterium]